MTNFKYIDIENFKSIKKGHLDFDKGLWEIVGVNEDGPFASNGSGKTNYLEAIQQCIFNRTTFNRPIDDFGHKAVCTTTSAHQYSITS